MDNNYLQELIDEAQRRGGGLMLSLDSKPAAVVLTVEKYNQIMSYMSSQTSQNQGEATLTVPKPGVMPAKPTETVLVTGGAGYIGSHAARQLLKEGYKVVVLDNLSAGLRSNVPTGAKFVEGDLSDVNLLRDLFNQENISAVMHFAASIEVEESVREPEKYFENNVLNTARLVETMVENNVKRLIFSSTCAVYKEQSEAKKLSELSPLGPTSPYGSTKFLAEQVIGYFAQYFGLKAIIFRYFNACGFEVGSGIKATHESHLIAKVMQVVAGRSPHIIVNGTDYPTFDGTCIRDYVHVMDIATPHVLALKKLHTQTEGVEFYNIGTGHGSSVKEVINCASEVLGKIIPMEIGARRAGDAVIMVADNTKLQNNLGYHLQYSNMENIIKSSL